MHIPGFTNFSGSADDRDQHGESLRPPGLALRTPDCAVCKQQPSLGNVRLRKLASVGVLPVLYNSS
ncbi:hypothetical protein JMJ77_0013813, partial [Colletotrichum scovillei]